MYKKPLLQELWEELDSVVYRLMTDGWDKGSLSAEEMRAWGIEIGQAQGLAYAIAMTYDMLDPNVEWVRAEAMRRWERHLENPTPIGRRGGVGPQVLRNARRDLSLRGRAGHRRMVDSRGGLRVGVARNPVRVPLGRVRRVAGKQGEQ